MKDGKCSKKYTRQLIQETQTGVDGYPSYRRRQQGQGGYTVSIPTKAGNQIGVDNRRIVPYTPLLSKMF